MKKFFTNQGIKQFWNALEALGLPQDFRVSNWHEWNEDVSLDAFEAWCQRNTPGFSRFFEKDGFLKVESSDKNLSVTLFPGQQMPTLTMCGKKVTQTKDIPIDEIFSDFGIERLEKDKPEDWDFWATFAYLKWWANVLDDLGPLFLNRSHESRDPDRDEYLECLEMYEKRLGLR